MNWLLVIGAIVLSSFVVGVVALVEARRWSAARRWAIVIGVGVAALDVAIVLHNVLSAMVGGEESISFIVALVVAPAAFTVGTLGLAIAVLRDPAQRELGTALLVAGSGAALFALYSLFALIATAIEGRNPPYQAVIEAVVVPVAVLALVAGAVAAPFLVRGTPRPAAHA